MKRFVLGLALCLVVAAPAFAGDKKGPSGLYRPTLSTFSNKYLRNVKLGVATQQEVIDYVGMPDKTTKIGDVDYLTYDIGNRKGGIIEYTFQIKDGVVIDVTYLNSGNFFGVTARDSARQLQGVTAQPAVQP